MSITGTHHFVSRMHAVRYYRAYGYFDVRSSVDRKIADGEIVIGKPTLQPGDVLVILDNGMRYGIERKD